MFIFLHPLFLFVPLGGGVTAVTAPHRIFNLLISNLLISNL